MNESIFPVPVGGLDRDREETEREDKRMQDAIREAKTLPVADCAPNEENKTMKESIHDRI